MDLIRQTKTTWSWVPMKPETKNGCAGEVQQQFTRPDEKGSEASLFQETKGLLFKYHR
jgi:hypothetical protein